MKFIAAFSDRDEVMPIGFDELLLLLRHRHLASTTLYPTFHLFDEWDPEEASKEQAACSCGTLSVTAAQQ